MKNKTIARSWDRIGPDDAANDRMLNAILEKNRSVHAADGTKTTGARKGIWIKWGATAAAFVLLLTGALALPKLLKQNAPVIDNASADRTAEKSGAEVGLKNDSEGNNVTVSQNPGSVGSDTKGIYIPGIDLASVAEGKADMIGLIVYKGGIYTQAGKYAREEAQRIDSIVGEYLGHATGSINEWSTQDDYAKEFASTFTGDVYAVNGYDTSFRICVRNSCTDENGEHVVWIEFLDRLKDITISAGKDLFEDRLRLSDRVESIRWLTHNDWNNENRIYRDASFDQSIWDAFLDAVDNGEFVYTYLPDGSFYEDHPYSSIYETPNQAHLYLAMEDGTKVELRLIEGGYVGYQELGWYFVKIPGEAFEDVYNACGGTHLTDW